MPVDPTSLMAGGPDWTAALEAADPAAGAGSGLEGAGLGGLDGAGSGSGFGGVLTDQIQQLADLQTQAADASAALASGTATDPAETVMAVERARLSMQLASTLRTKGVEAITEIFHTQV
jgi:flagellar hook-basal body complex protein FliE